MFKVMTENQMDQMENEMETGFVYGLVGTILYQ